jgi:hypothetical protein
LATGSVDIGDIELRHLQEGDAGGVSTVLRAGVQYVCGTAIERKVHVDWTIIGAGDGNYAILRQQKRLAVYITGRKDGIRCLGQPDNAIEGVRILHHGEHDTKPWIDDDLVDARKIQAV